MRVRVVLLGLLLVVAAAAQQMTVEALVRMVRSSIELDHKDKEVANYLKRVKLTERLDAAVIEDLQGLGAGPRTIEALNTLRATSMELPKAEPVPEKEKPVIPPPSAEEQEQILNSVREYAMGYSRRLPNYICTQVTRRYVDPNGLEFWHKVDTVTTKLTYFEEKEDYKVILINNRPVDMGIHETGGSTSSGEFGSMMKEIFDPETEATFQWKRWGKLRGRLCHVYEYVVRRDRSKWSISFEKTMRTVPAYRGLIFVDSDLLMVLRITLEAVNIEPSFPVQEASTQLDYDLVQISSAEHMLPLKSEMRMRQGKMLVKNEVEFRLYRMFGADAVIKFDTPEELPEEMFQEEPPGGQ